MKNNRKNRDRIYAIWHCKNQKSCAPKILTPKLPSKMVEKCTNEKIEKVETENTMQNMESGEHTDSDPDDWSMLKPTQNIRKLVEEECTDDEIANHDAHKKSVASKPLRQ